MRWPRISVITPSFNQGEFLEETVQSVINQNYPNLEYIVIDGGSTDTSIEIIKKYESHLAYWVSEKDNGQSHSVNKGFRRATGEIIGWLNSDDTYLQNAFERIITLFKDNPDVDVIYGNFVYIDNHGNWLRKRKVFKNLTIEMLLDHDYIGQPALFFRRSIFEKIGYLDESLHYSMDWDFVIRLRKNYAMLHCPFYLATYRVNKNTKTSLEATTEYKRELKLFQQKHCVSSSQTRGVSQIVKFTKRIKMLSLRIYTVLYDGPLGYIRVFKAMRSSSIKSIIDFLIWRLKY